MHIIRNLRRLAPFLFLVALAAPAAAEVAPQPRRLLERLAGPWVLEGQIAGAQTTHDVRGAMVLNGNYLRLEETSRETTADGAPAYQATVLIGWSEARSQYVCFWFDNTEVADVRTTCTARNVGDTIPLEFRNAKGDLIFETLMSAQADGSWRWRMSNVANGGRSLFADVRLRRP